MAPSHVWCYDVMNMANSQSGNFRTYTPPLTVQPNII